MNELIDMLKFISELRQNADMVFKADNMSPACYVGYTEALSLMDVWIHQRMKEYDDAIEGKS